ncbi:phosphatase PAP2 family protein [Zoogloea sp.]|uniref:phosphatase PAP2 family protein n=1 Tax=Zoogloea sp. TaxID=49181 RepID=UPI0035B3CBF7
MHYDEPVPDETPASGAPLPRSWLIAPALALAVLALACIAAGNQSVFITLNTAASGVSPSLWSALSLTGSVLGMLALLAPTLKTRPRWLASALLASPLALAFSEGGKRIFDTMRPAGVLESGSFNLIGQKLYVHSFPSGHATTAFVVAAALIFAWPEANTRTRLAVAAAAALIAFSRIAVGAHWPLDVLVGACGGWLIGALGGVLSARWRFWERRSGVRAMAAIALGSSLALLFIDLGYPSVHLYQIGLAAWGIGGAASALGKETETRS